MYLEGPFLIPVREDQVCQGGEDFGLQRHPMVLEHIGANTIGVVVNQRPQHLFRTVRGEENVVIQQENTVTVNFIVV